MATNLAIDPDLLEKALQVSGEKTKKAAVTAALEEYVRYRKQLGVLDLAGTIEFDPTYDYKAQRRRKR